MKIDLMALFRNLPALKTKLEMCIGASNRKNKGGAAATEETAVAGRGTQMNSLTRQ